MTHVKLISQTQQYLTRFITVQTIYTYFQIILTGKKKQCIAKISITQEICMKTYKHSVLDVNKHFIIKLA